MTVLEFALSFLCFVAFLNCYSSPNETVEVREQLFEVVANLTEDIGETPSVAEVEQLAQTVTAVIGKQ